MSTKYDVVVVGSCMIDFTSYVSRLPYEGETLHGTKFVTAFGGKGANQCVAAAKVGAKTALVARVGDDTWGRDYINNLDNLNVDTSEVTITPLYSSGIAQINVADSGANQIVIVAAANTQLSASDVRGAAPLIESARVVVCQLETAQEVALEALQIAKHITILNGAPAISVGDFDERLLRLPSIFCVNETEAVIFTGMNKIDSIEDAKHAVSLLLEKGCNTVILTLGKSGAVFASKSNTVCVHVPSPQVRSIDSTGAGDAFIGILACLLATRPDLDLKDCIRAANHGAADSVTRLGTQTSFPDSKILQEYFRK